MTRLPLLILLIFGPFLVLGSAPIQNYLKQLEDSLEKAQSDADRLELYNELSLGYITQDVDRSKVYADSALAIAERLGSLSQQARAFTNLGHYYEIKEGFTAALAYHRRAFRLANQSEDLVEMARVNYNLSMAYSELGDYESSLEHIFIALEYDMELGDSLGIMEDYGRIGRLYDNLGSFSQAKKYLTMASNMANRAEDSMLLGAFNGQLGHIHFRNNDYDSAIYFFDQALLTALRNKDLEDYRFSVYHKVRPYLAQERFEEARALLDSAIKIPYESKIIDLIDDFSWIHYYLALDSLPEAQQRALDYYRKSRVLNNIYECRTATEFLAEISSQLGNYKEAYQYSLLARNYQDSLVNQSNVQRLESQVYDFELSKKEKREKELEAAVTDKEKLIARQNQIQWLSFGLLAFLALFAFFSFRAARLRKQHQKELEAKNKDLEKAYQEVLVLNKEVQNIMYHMGHDLKSPLNSLEAFLSLLRPHIPEEKNDQKLFEMAESAVKQGQSFINQLLDQYRLETEPLCIVKVEFPEFIDFMASKYQALANAKAICLEHEVSGTFHLHSDQALLERILDNLLSNAIKFSAQEAHVFLSAGKIGNRVWIKVQDQGPGFSEEDQKKMYQKFQRLSARPTAGESSHGLGLSSVKSLCQKLNANIEMESKLNEGATFTVNLPDLELPSS